MKNLTAIGVGAALGLVAYYIVRKFEVKTKSSKDFSRVKSGVTKLKSTEVKTEKEDAKEVKEVEVTATVQEEKKAKDRTLSETYASYSQEQNDEMAEKVNEVIAYLEEHGIYADPKVGELKEHKSISDICHLVTRANNQLKHEFDKALELTRNTLLTKSTRKIVRLIPLPEEIQSKDTNANNISIYRTIRLRHIDEARSRIDRITRKFTMTSLMILEKDYFQLLYNLVVMHRDLLTLKELLPTLDNVNPSVNVISDDGYNHNRKKFLQYMELNLTPEEYRYLSVRDKSLLFEEYK